MKRNLLAGLVGVGLLLASVPVVLAHHSISAEFDTTKTITFTGVVKKVEWLNPHIYTQIEVKQADGKVVVYRVEGGAPNALFRNGTRPDFLKPGEIVNFSGRPAKNPKSTNVNGSMTLADGTNPMSRRAPAAQ